MDLSITDQLLLLYGALFIFLFIVLMFFAGAKERLQFYFMNRRVQINTGIILIVVGVFQCYIHFRWSDLYEIIISSLGVGAIIKGIMIVLSPTLTNKALKIYNSPLFNFGMFLCLALAALFYYRLFFLYGGF